MLVRLLCYSCENVQKRIRISRRCSAVSFSSFSFFNDIDFTEPLSKREQIYQEKLPLLMENESNLVEFLSSTRKGISHALHFRSDVLQLLKKDSERPHKNSLKRIDHQLSSFLRSALCVDALHLRRITYEDSSGLVLERIARADSVHQIRNLRDMKKRLHTNRRCYALFHPR